MEASINREAQQIPVGQESVGGLGKGHWCSSLAFLGSPITSYNLLAKPHPNKFSIKGLLHEWLSSVICFEILLSVAKDLALWRPTHFSSGLQSLGEREDPQ